MWESTALVNDTNIAGVPSHVEEALREIRFGERPGATDRATSSQG
jgi:hypothetical protein